MTQSQGVVMEDGTKKLVYKTQGTCSQFIEVAIKDGIVQHCQFYGGCDGNTKGLAQIVVGMKGEDVIKKLDGVRCGMKPTSCPDQLCRAIETCMAQ